MGVVVRAAEPGDVDALVSLAATSALASQWGRERYSEMILAPGSAAVQRTLLVAEREGNAIGFAAASALVAVSPAEAELENLAVLPAMQGRGVGAALLQAILRWAVAAGAGPVRLEVRSANVAALRVYQRHGFVQTGVRQGYYAAPADDAVCMERLLP